ncbi:hypothetical protein PFHG_03713 [Plasmodium falciparum HB3]|uniref:Rifin n=1 Tax=Plasmodium falciparum (isolate HB3) TaxID=137071 RepID=A0A0L7KF03_PLAFX|nr:hypothetical protein PFHG_03713 [Plasmodium falciparum HB3]
MRRLIVVIGVKPHNENKPYTKSHTAITALRVLSKCELYVSNYDNDPDLESVEENFDIQTSQRFEEYDERMKEKQQKCKEQCEKDIQKIILKDQIEKSLTEKVEKDYLKCGCGLRGVAVSVGIIGPVAVNEWTKTATAMAIDFAIQECIKEGIQVVIERIKLFDFISSYLTVDWEMFINGSNYNTASGLIEAANSAMFSKGNSCTSPTGYFGRVCEAISNAKASFSSVAVEGEQAAFNTTKGIQVTMLSAVEAPSANMYSAIGYSVLAILIILLVMVIIYLVLRYRRKKQMNKKLQYTKLLNQ